MQRRDACSISTLQYQSRNCEAIPPHVASLERMHRDAAVDLQENDHRQYFVTFFLKASIGGNRSKLKKENPARRQPCGVLRSTYPVARKNNVMANISWHLRHVKLLSALALAACTTGAFASEAPVSAAPEHRHQAWLTSGFLSYHLEREPNYNENNRGIGLEWQFDEANVISAGVYRNSVRHRSHYVQYIWTPLALGPFRFGAAAGLLDGYPELNDGDIAVALIPVATLKFKLFGHDAGVNFVYIPTIAEKVDGAIAMQLKVRVF
jgi:hypothetical protein